MIIELGEWLPDLPAIDNPGLVDVENLAPSVQGWRTVRGHEDVNDMPSGTTNLFGGFSSEDNGTVEDFCGDADDLYRLTWNGTDVTTANASKSANAYSTASLWDFCQYGSKVIAVNGGTSGADTPQVITLGTANFADLGGSPPNAKTCATLKDFVVFGHTYDATDGERSSRIRWCGFGDETSWSVSAATQADLQDLQASAGTVQRLFGGDDIMFATSTGAWLMEYVGPPQVMAFTELGSGRARGTSHPHSVIRDGDVLYFWADVGPVAVHKSGEVKYLAEGKVADYLLKAATYSTYSPIAYRDPQYGAICWQWGAAFSVYYFPSSDSFSKINEADKANTGHIWTSRLVQVLGVITEAPLFKINGGLTLYSRSKRTQMLTAEFKTSGRRLAQGRRTLVKEARLLGTSFNSDMSADLQCVVLNNPPQVQGGEYDDGDFTSFTQNAAADDVYHGFFEGRYHFFRGVITSATSARSESYFKSLEITDASPTGRY